MKKFREWLESFHPAEIEKINQSYDKHGFDSAISVKDIMPLLKNKMKKHHHVLDYGAGKVPKISKLLNKLGYQVTPHEIGDNRTHEHDPHALSKKYDIVLALNVLNHLPDHEKFKQSLQQMKNVLNPNGCCIVTLPKHPRAMKLTKNKIKEVLDDLFPKHTVKTKPEKGSLLILEKD